MTELLEKAFAEVSKLLESEQDIFSRWILEELASEKRWDMAFTNSQYLLSRLADEALAEHRAGKTEVPLKLAPMALSPWQGERGLNGYNKVITEYADN